MANNNVITNPFNVTAPAVWVAGNDTGRGYKKHPQLDEHTISLLIAMAVSGNDSVDLRKLALSQGKRDNRKNLTGRPGTNTHPARRSVKKNTKESITTAVSGRVAKSVARPGAHHIPENIQRHGHRELRKRSEWEHIQREKLLARLLGSGNYKKQGKEAVDGLVGMMEGFGIGGEKVKDTMEMEMNGLEMKMAMLGVIHEDDGKIL